MVSEQDIAKLVIRLVAETGGISAQLKSAESAIVGFGSVFKKILGGLSFAAVAYEIKSIVTESVAWAAEMEKMASKTGMTTEALSRLVEAGDHVGTSGETIQRAMKFLSKSMGEAQDGSLAFREDFKKLGIVFEDTTGKLLPSGDVFLQLADAVKKYGTTTEVLNIAQRLMGRGFQEIIPLAERGSVAINEMADGADRAGSVIKGSIGAQSLELKIIIKELGDQFSGFVRTVVYTFLPSMIDSHKKVLDLAVSLNSLKQYILPAADALKVFAVAGLAAAAIHILLLTDAFVALTWGIRNAAFMIEYFAKTSLLAILKNPVLLAIAAVGLLAAAFVKLRMDQRDAADQAKNLAEGYAAGGLDTARTNISNLSAIIVDLRQKQEAYGKTSDEIAKTQPFAHLRDDYKGAIKAYTETKAAADQYQVILDLLIKKEKELAEAAKAPLPATTDPKVLEEVRKKIDELKNSTIALTNPTLAAKNAMTAYIADLKKNNKIGKDFVQVEKDLWTAFNRFASADWSKKISEAKIGASLQAITANFEKMNQDLTDQYARGETDLATYFTRRRLLIVAQSDAEIAELQKKRPLLAVGGPEQIALDQEIANKRAQSSLKIQSTNEEERKSWEDLWKVIREGKVTLDTETITGKIDALSSAYDNGNISIKAYYDERDKLAQEGSRVYMTALDADLTNAKTEQEAYAVIYKMKVQEQKDANDAVKREWDRFNAQRAADTAKLQNDAMLAASKAAAVPGGQTGGEEALRRQGLANQTQIEADYASKIQTITLQQVKTEQDVADKKLAIAKLLADKKIALENNTKDTTNAIQLAVLSNALTVTTGISDLFGKMYEMSGQKAKLFFFLQKALAVAEILINTEVAAIAALKMGPFLGIPMSAIVRAMGYASAAMVAGLSVAGLKKGGPVRGPGTETSDSIPAYLSRGEYVHPAKAVRYYGTDIMEALRRMLIPKEMLQGFGRFAIATSGGSFAEGGLVAGNLPEQGNRLVTLVNNWNIQTIDAAGFDQLLLSRQQMIEGMQIESMRRGGVMRDAVRRYR